MEGRADSRAAAVSPAYAAGGVEYYSSIMQRNKALRVLHANGQEGHHFVSLFPIQIIESGSGQNLKPDPDPSCLLTLPGINRLSILLRPSESGSESLLFTVTLSRKAEA